MNRQTLSLKETVSRHTGRDVTLASTYRLANSLAGQHHYSESLALYYRACVGYVIALGEDHPITRDAHKQYAMVMEETQSLAKLGISSSDTSGKQ
jgi:hypothetical protein